MNNIVCVFGYLMYNFVSVLQHCLSLLVTMQHCRKDWKWLRDHTVTFSPGSGTQDEVCYV